MTKFIEKLGLTVFGHSDEQDGKQVKKAKPGRLLAGWKKTTAVAAKKELNTSSTATGPVIACNPGATSDNENNYAGGEFDEDKSQEFLDTIQAGKSSAVKVQHCKVDQVSHMHQLNNRWQH
jgi:hypothetical protein